MSAIADALLREIVEDPDAPALVAKEVRIATGEQIPEATVRAVFDVLRTKRHVLATIIMVRDLARTA